jgi:hypothetical protein
MDLLPNEHLLVMGLLVLAVLIGTHAYALGTWLCADTHTRKGMRGGLDPMGICLRMYYWISMLVSTAGPCLSFYIHVTYTSGVLIIIIFMCLLASLIVFNLAFLKKNLPRVFGSLCCVFLGYTSLMLYTLYRFPVGATTVNNPTLLWATHICNLACVLHSLIFDMWIWQYGWWHYLNLLTADVLVI